MTGKLRAETSLRDPDLALARIHLRLGSLGLARAELEALAGRDALDVEALLDLAEARWRTSDLPGAGDAAQAYLASGGDAAIGYLIAAEAVAAVGRPTEARRLASEAMARAEGTLDGLFAGMPRSLIWPSDSTQAGIPAETLFEGMVVAPGSDRTAPASEASPASTVGAGMTEPSTEPGLWDAHPAVSQPPPLPSADSELDAGRAAIAAGDIDTAAVHLAVALRLSPALAPVVLDVAGSAPPGRSIAALELVRGDAYRAVGHETDARRAYAAAAELTGNGDRLRRPADPALAGVPATPDGESQGESS
jgi:hypothetical protein